jgi:hypothetical protein
MANPFAGTETYEVDLVDKSDGETWTVTMRPLNAGHQAKLLDQMALEESDRADESEVTRPRLGAMKLLLVSEAVVRWTLPQPPTPHTIAELRTDLFEQLYEKARFAGDELGNPTTPQSPTTPAPAAETTTAPATAVAAGGS